MYDNCDRDYIEHMEKQHDIDLIAALDPESDADRDFTEWLKQYEEGRNSMLWSEREQRIAAMISFVCDLADWGFSEDEILSLIGLSGE